MSEKTPVPPPAELVGAWLRKAHEAIGYETFNGWTVTDVDLDGGRMTFVFTESTGQVEAVYHYQFAGQSIDEEP
jgi:hypothetical protein